MVFSPFFKIYLPISISIFISFYWFAIIWLTSLPSFNSKTYSFLSNVLNMNMQFQWFLLFRNDTFSIASNAHTSNKSVLTQYTYNVRMVVSFFLFLHFCKKKREEQQCVVANFIYGSSIGSNSYTLCMHIIGKIDTYELQLHRERPFFVVVVVVWSKACVIVWLWSIPVTFSFNSTQYN